MRALALLHSVPLASLSRAAGVLSAPFRVVYDAVVVAPLWRMYRTGPSISASLGFWDNASDADVCHRLTGVASTFWTSNADAESECVRVIANTFQRHVVVIETILYFVALTYTTRSALGLASRYVTKRVAAAAAATTPQSCAAHSCVHASS